MAERREKIYRLGLADPRTGPERVVGALARATSPDKKQNRQWDDSPTKMAVNRRDAAKRADAKKRKK